MAPPSSVAFAMEQRRMFTPVFMLGNWVVYPRHGFIENEEKRVFLEPKLIDVLVLLVENADEVISIDQLLERCWPRGIYGDNPVHKAVALLRKALGDDAKSPRYIATVRKRGYRIVATVTLGGKRRGAAAIPGARPPSTMNSAVIELPDVHALDRGPTAFETSVMCESSHHRSRCGPPRGPYGRRAMRFLYRPFSETFR